jgi:hypothetical protein
MVDCCISRAINVPESDCARLSSCLSMPSDFCVTFRGGRSAVFTPPSGCLKALSLRAQLQRPQLNPNGIPSALSLRSQLQRPQLNPNGIPSFSPALRRPRRYAGLSANTILQPWRGCVFGPLRHRPRACSNPFRVEIPAIGAPRVARSSQPWADGCNPFGIEEIGAELWVTTKLQLSSDRRTSAVAFNY